ncbi:HNH endonuclease [Nostoc sp.]|uniref:HNH endonuclease n=1 Tax=Nostoc sp. TaxID=1180 RepID=UPI002FF89C31
MRRHAAVKQRGLLPREDAKSDSESASHFQWHISIPKSQGGNTTLDNLALSCQGCNNRKYNKTVIKSI